MNTVMFNELPVGALFRVVSEPQVSDPFSHEDIFIKIRNSKEEDRAFNITKYSFYFDDNINWNTAPTYCKCTNWVCTKVSDLITETINKNNSNPTQSTEERFNYILGCPDWDMNDNAFLALTDSQFNLLDYLINETSIFDEDIRLMAVDTKFKEI